MYPYQVGAALFATRSPYSKGVVLMGESGLGKSTEAMLVVTQKWYEGKTRILIILPNSDLLVQWEKLIEHKYSVPFVAIASTLQLIEAGDTFDQEAVILTTYDFALQGSDYLKKIIWDLTVFEEASLLASVYKEDNKQARTLKKITEGSFKLLLTGTPIEKNILDLYGLMYFIDETIFPSEQKFMARYFRKPENYSELAELVSKYCFRTLRSQAKQYTKIPERIVLTCEFEQSKPEQRLYDLIKVYVDKLRKIAFPEMNAYDLALMLFDLQGSSTSAIVKAIEGIVKRIEKIPGAEAEIAEFREMLTATAEIEVDEKLKLLITSLEACFKILKRTGANRKVVIFTGNRETQQYLYDHLKEKYKTYVYNGSKDYRMIDGFKTDGEIMISTDHGSRGFNLEEASLVINYDLLYNTLKMEQRIDRCHRLNQQNDVIVLNFLNKSNMAYVRKLELVNKRVLVADGVFGQSDAILGGFTEDINKTLKKLKIRTQVQIQFDYEETMKNYEEENRHDVEAAEHILFTTFTKELVKYCFNEYNKNNTDCRFIINDKDKAVSATEYIELPYLFYYWTGGQNKRYKALKEFKKITLMSPLAKGILYNIGCADSGRLIVDSDIETCKIAFYTIDILAGHNPVGKVFNLLCGVTDSGKHLTNEECLRILALPVAGYEETGGQRAYWLKNHKSGKMDRLIPLDDFVQQSIQDYSSAQAEEIECLKRKASVAKNALEHDLDDLKTKINELQKQSENTTGDRMARLVLERKLGEANNNLLRKEESIFFDSMRIDLACEESIKDFIEKEKITARMLKHFEIEIDGGNQS